MKGIQEYWQPGICPTCGDVTVRIVGVQLPGKQGRRRGADVVIRECSQCKRDLLRDVEKEK